MRKNEIKDFLIISLKLLIICSVVAVIIAFVNFVTKDRIAYNERLSTSQALFEIYGYDFAVDNDQYTAKDADGNVLAVCRAVKAQLEGDVHQIYEYQSNGKVSGYCVSVSPMGFKANINMLVAINSNLTIHEVKIISHSETSGIGTKIQNYEFLGAFSDKTYPVSESVDIISGATKSSKPVIFAVDNALTCVTKYINSKEAE